MSDSRFLWIPVAVALATGIALATIHHTDDQHGLPGDGDLYYRLAARLCSEHSYGGHTYEPPGYPVFLAMVLGVTGRSILAVYLVQAFLFAATLIVTGKVALELTGSRAVSNLTVLACAAWRPYYDYVPFVCSEVLATFLIALALLWLLRAWDQPTGRRLALAGGLLGAASYVKAILLPCPFFLAALFAHGAKSWRVGVRQGLLLLVVAWGVVLPWTVRNYVVTERFIPLSSAGPLCFWMGNNPDMYARRGMNDILPWVAESAMAGKTEAEKQSYYVRQGVRYIRQCPARAARIFFFKFSELWLGSLGRDVETLVGRPYRIGSFAVPKQSLIAVPLLLLAIIGWVCLPAAHKRKAQPMLVLLAVWTVGYVLIYAERRYSKPVRFCEITLACVAIQHIARRCLRAVDRPPRQEATQSGQ